MRIIATAVVFVMLSGCAASRPDLTREEYLALVNRTYEDTSAEEGLAAAERLFRLADPRQVKFQHFDNGFRVYRRWSVYMVIAAAFGTDIWDVRAAPSGQGTKLTVHLSRTSSNITGVPTPTAAGDTSATVITSPGTGGVPVDSTAIYDLFWGRMDYLLGRRPEWMTCEEASARRKEGLTYGPLDALCSVTTDDLAPGEEASRGAD